MRFPSEPFILRAGRVLWLAYDRTLAPLFRKLFLLDLIVETRNFGDTTWMGQPIWQNVLDLHTMQETIYEVKPELLIECGTHCGGSALFFAHLFQIIGSGRVVTVDLVKMHDLSHPLITFLEGSSVDPQIIAEVRQIAGSVKGPVMVVLDSDHSASHVRREMEAYCGLVTTGSYMFTQDGALDDLVALRLGPPGPRKAIHEFLGSHPEFEVDYARSRRFLITNSPMGWLKRK